MLDETTNAPAIEQAKALFANEEGFSQGLKSHLEKCLSDPKTNGLILLEELREALSNRGEVSKVTTLEQWLRGKDQLENN